MLNVVTINEAVRILKDSFGDYKTGFEEVEIINSLGRILAQDIVSNENLPAFIRSTVDGYAVRAKDSFGASESVPSMFKVIGEVEMGQPASMQVGYGEAVYVPTGGMMPEGTDAAVMIEHVEKLDESEIAVNKPAAPLENVVSAGDDVKIGERVLEKGQKLRPQDIGVLAGLGITRVKVVRPVSIGIISTGDEIVSPDSQIKDGQVRDINSLAVGAACIEEGCNVKLYGVVRDEYELLREKLELAVSENDIVLVSGGSSAGTKDMTCDIINSLGKPGVLVHGLQTKPGKPTIIGKVDEKAVFGLPGHPLAALMIFKVVVKSLINKISGQKDRQRTIFAHISQNYSSAHGREEYVMVELEKINDAYIAKPVYTKSALISSMVRADGYIRIDANKEGLVSGEKVEVFLF